MYLSKAASNPTDRIDYHAPSGTVFGRFFRQPPPPPPASTPSNAYYNPTDGGAGADLKDNDDKTSSRHTWTLTFRKSQLTYTFDDFGVDANPAVLTKMVDRNSNEIDLGYSSGVWTSMTDTHGLPWAISHTGAGYVSAIKEQDINHTTLREWDYGYDPTNAAHLTSYTDPTGAVTRYGWTSDQVTTVTDPAQSSGNHPTATLTYSSAQLTGWKFTKDTSGGTYNSTFSYTGMGDGSTSTASARCHKTADIKNADYSTDVTDPNGHTTTYCFTDRDDAAGKDRVVGTVDALGHRRSDSYSPDQQGSSSSSAANDNVSGGSTVNTYNGNNALATATEPTDTAGDTAASNFFQYNTATTSAGASFLPSSTTNAQGSCTGYGYDVKGNMTDSYAGLSGGTGHDCSASGGQHSHVDYTTHGTPSVAYNPSGSAATGDTTQYAYYCDATPSPTRAELKNVVRPGGNTTCTTDRTLCTSYTYDTLSRIASVTDGNGKLTTYSYDGDDRITQVLLAGTTSCSTSAGTCVKYTYDDEGNLQIRADKTGSTTFAYDLRNLIKGETLPDGTVFTIGRDPAGNISSYAQQLSGQPSNSVAYAYDDADNVTTITDPTGVFTVTSKDDGNRDTITYPTSPAVTVNYNYTKAGRVKSITPTGGTGLNAISYSYADAAKGEHGLIQSMTTNSVTTSYSYDSSQRLTKADASTGTDYTYTYDVDGNVTSSLTGTGAKVYFGYNKADELCWKGTTTGTQLAQACPATPAGDTTYTSDKAGNNLGTSAAPIGYNANNQVTSISDPAGGTAVAQTYNDLGNDLRVTAGTTSITTGPLGDTARTTSSGTTYYTRDPQGHVIGQHGAAGTAFYYSDVRSSTVAVIGHTGAAATTYTYGPYGDTTSSGTITTPFQWTGGYYDIGGALGTVVCGPGCGIVAGTAFAAGGAGLESFAGSLIAGDSVGTSAANGALSTAVTIAGGALEAGGFALRSKIVR